MGHWKRLIKIPSATVCYYCIKNMTCRVHVFYCLFVHVPVPDHFAAIMLPVYVVLTCFMLYILWWHLTHVHVYSALLLSAYILFCMDYLLLKHNTVGWLCCILHLHIHLHHYHVHVHHVITRQHYLLYKLDTTHDPMITG